ncbi:MAG: tetratricopeptide repeat protein [Caulobacteraceae bacterium]
MWTSVIVLLVAAVLVAVAASWVLCAYRRAGADAKSARAALLACAAVGVVALTAYLATGRPDLPGAPYDQRLRELKQRPLSTYTIDEALAVLAEGAREHPGDPAPHVFSGQLLLSNGRPQEAARAFEAALRRDPRRGAALLGLGEALTASEGRFTPEALALFAQAGELTNDPMPWAYQAMAARQAGRAEDARRFWGEALARMEIDHPLRATAQRLSGPAGR